MSEPTGLSQRLAPLRAQWSRIAPRERRLILIAAAAVLLALLWLLVLSPALRVLRQAPVQRAELQAKAQQLQSLKVEADVLKAMPRMEHEAARQALQAAVKQRLGDSAQMSLMGDRVQITLKDTPAQALADWLADARINARAIPVEARLRRSGDTSPGAPALWSGSLSLSLPNP